jgi:hypothetical protein
MFFFCDTSDHFSMRIFCVWCVYLQLVAAVIVTVFIYLHVTQIEFVQSVLGTNLVIVASGLVIISGCLLFLLAIVGIIGACISRMVALAVVSFAGCFVV